MEIFLFIALFFIYILTAFTVPEHIVKRMWILAYVFAFILTFSIPRFKIVPTEIYPNKP